MVREKLMQRCTHSQGNVNDHHPKDHSILRSRTDPTMSKYSGLRMSHQQVPWRKVSSLARPCSKEVPKGVAQTKR
mgnify:CR=1 FL=1